MLTRCPGCSTTFRVHPEQLKVRQGKVRCGECQGVFNALDSLIEELVVVPPAAVPVATDTAALAAMADEIAVPPAPTFGAPVTATAAAPVLAPDAAPLTTIGLDFILPEPGAAGPVEIIDIGEQLPEPGAHGAPAPMTAGTPDASREAADTPDAADVAATADATADFEPALHDTPAGAGGASTWLWASGVVLTIVGLLFQGLMHYRVEIATMAPQTRAYFTTACSLIGCQVDLPRRIDQLAIETSDLHPDPAFPGQPGRLGLQLNLHNRAPFAQTWPHLELTLTDTNDRPIARRVLAASDYLLAQKPTPAMFEQGIAARQEISIALALDTGKLLASGYRLYLFYP